MHWICERIRTSARLNLEIVFSVFPIGPVLQYSNTPLLRIRVENDKTSKEEKTL